MASLTEEPYVTRDLMAHCPRRYAYTEPCRRCGGSGREPDADEDGAECLSCVLIFCILIGVAFALGWWLA